MDQALPTLPGKLTRVEYSRWVAAQPRGRFELMDGMVVAMAPERGAHLRAKGAAYRALVDAIAAAPLDCQALPDGATVEVDDRTAYEPDAVVNSGAPMADDAIAAPSPVIVVEVVSPSSKSIDTQRKLVDYFRVPSIRHYLIMDTERRVVIHHRREDGAAIATRILAAGRLVLEPPGLSLEVEALFAG
jgi:Uma2 family endonuclease